MTDDTDPGGARVPRKTPAEVPADNRDPGVERPMPGGDTVPAPDTTSPTPAPTEIPQTGTGGPDTLSADAIASNERGNGSIGTAMALEVGDDASSTESALARAANTRDAAGR